MGGTGSRSRIVMTGLEEISGLDQKSTPSISIQAHPREPARPIYERHSATAPQILLEALGRVDRWFGGASDCIGK